MDTFNPMYLEQLRATFENTLVEEELPEDVKAALCGLFVLRIKEGTSPAQATRDLQPTIVWAKREAAIDGIVPLLKETFRHFSKDRIEFLAAPVLRYLRTRQDASVSSAIRNLKDVIWKESRAARSPLAAALLRAHIELK